MRVSGTFDVKLEPQKPDNAPAQGAGIGRVSIDKQYHGGLEGTSQGEMLAYGDGTRSGAYVAIERFSGTVNGRKGSFALVHRSNMSNGVPERWEILVIPDSGTEALTGIAGELRIIFKDKQHLYEADFTLPDAS